MISDRITDNCDSRVAFATENLHGRIFDISQVGLTLISLVTDLHQHVYTIFMYLDTHPINGKNMLERFLSVMLVLF